jgi:hypothetical protein
VLDLLRVPGLRNQHEQPGDVSGADYHQLASPSPNAQFYCLPFRINRFDLLLVFGLDSERGFHYDAENYLHADSDSLFDTSSLFRSHGVLLSACGTIIRYMHASLPPFIVCS